MSAVFRRRVGRPMLPRFRRFRSKSAQSGQPVKPLRATPNKSRSVSANVGASSADLPILVQIRVEVGPILTKSVASSTYNGQNWPRIDRTWVDFEGGTKSTNFGPESDGVDRFCAELGRIWRGNFARDRPTFARNRRNRCRCRPISRRMSPNTGRSRPNPGQMRVLPIGAPARASSTPVVVRFGPQGLHLADI